MEGLGGETEHSPLLVSPKTAETKTVPSLPTSLPLTPGEEKASPGTGTGRGAFDEPRFSGSQLPCCTVKELDQVF